jgi:NAD-dependent SIR2 family protein deacetylase
MPIGPTTTVTCLDCEEEIELDEEAEPGDIILCCACEAKMELVSVDPVRLVFFLGDDWEEGDTDDDSDPWSAY